jgi:hypothetical protein
MTAGTDVVETGFEYIIFVDREVVFDFIISSLFS